MTTFRTQKKRKDKRVKGGWSMTRHAHLRETVRSNSFSLAMQRAEKHSGTQVLTYLERRWSKSLECTLPMDHLQKMDSFMTATLAKM